MRELSKYELVDDCVHREEVPSLACNHQEADTPFIWHIKHMCESLQESNIVTYGSDTDVLIVLLTHSNILQAHLLMDIGVSYNTRRYIDVSVLALSMGLEMCGAIAGLQAFIHRM